MYFLKIYYTPSYTPNPKKENICHCFTVAQRKIAGHINLSFLEIIAYKFWISEMIRVLLRK
jgi:hypothetical protein